MSTFIIKEHRIGVSECKTRRTQIINLYWFLMHDMIPVSVGPEPPNYGIGCYWGVHLSVWLALSDSLFRVGEIS